MSKQKYRESLGLIGMQSLCFLADRMFESMDTQKRGYICLDEYLCYIDVLMYGTDYEKVKQSFELIDLTGQGKLTFSDFKKVVDSFAQMWSAATGQPTPINLSYIRSIFDKLSKGKDGLKKDYFDLEDFVRG